MVDNDKIKKIFGSTTRIKLFDLFLNNIDRKYYVREITRLIDEQINSVRRELNNLYDIGIIDKTNQDRKLYYQINKQSEYYNPLRAIFAQDFELSTTDKSDNWLTRVSQVRSLVDFLYVSSSSDGQLGFLVIGDNSDQKLSKWAAEVEASLGKDMNYSIMELRDYQYRLAIKDKFLTEFLSSGVELVYSKSKERL